MARSKASKPQDKKKKPSKAAWKLVDRLATMVSVLAGAQAAALIWRAATGRKPPTPTESQRPDINTREAVAWAVLAGAIGGLLKVVVQRQVVGYWVRSTGTLPPGMKGPKSGR